MLNHLIKMERSPEGAQLNLVLRSRLLVGALYVLLSGCQPPSTAKQSPLNHFGPWTVSTSTYQKGHEPYLTNGLIGLRFDQLGTPIRAYFIDGYQIEGEEKLIEYKVRPVEGAHNNGEVTESVITQDLHRGTLVFEGKQGGRRFKNMVWLHPGVPVYELVHENADRHAYSLTREPNGEATLEPVDRDGQYPSSTWTQFWNVDIEIEGPEEDQFMIRSFLYHLRSSINPKSSRAVSPFGLSNSTYFGHVFWDADTWIFPALMLLDPERAKTIPLYRLNKLAGAQANYKQWVSAGRSVGNGNSLGSAPPLLGAAMFPWESSISGLETVPGPSKNQHHISPTVAFAVWQAARLGLVPEEAAEKLGTAVSRFLIDRTDIKAGVRRFRDTMSPDEFHVGDDDLYTNLVSEWCLRTFPVPNIDQKVTTFHRPKEGERLLNYAGDPQKSYKQAAGVLAVYPLQDVEAELQAESMLDAYAPKVIKNGPAMSDSLHGLIAARTGDADRAYGYWKRSWEPFVQTPLVQFCEKRNLKQSVFLTGLGGSLQTVLYGFAGIRIDLCPNPNAPLTKRLKSDLYFTAVPCLPKQWKSLKVYGLSLLGKQYDLEVHQPEPGTFAVKLNEHASTAFN